VSALWEGRLVIDVTCRDCQRPLSEHWTLAMSESEFRTWDKNELVCTKSRYDVRMSETE
jgi:hypothetical protein